MSFIHQKLWALLVCGPNSPGRQPLESLVSQLAHGSSLAGQAAHQGLAAHTAAMSAAAASSGAAVREAAVASGAAVAAAAAAGGAAAAAAARKGRAWGVRAALAAVFVATGAWFSVAHATYDTAALLVTSLPKTIRTAAWAVRAGLSYKRFAALRAGQDVDSDEYQEALGVLHTHWALELLAVCRANGGVYVKAGQFAASFGAVPREFRLTLAGLEDRAVPRPFIAIEAAVERELGDQGGMALFSQFDRTATAAASLAQVHRAVLRETGEAVAVKIQYPGLEAAVASDLVVLRAFNFMASIMFPDYRLGWMVDELDKKLAMELDFRTELRNSSRVATLIEHNKAVTLPRMQSHLCTKRLLVMEWVDGVKVNDKDAIKTRGINPRAVGLQLVRLFGELTLVHGFMHGDPHAGNLMVREKGRRSFWWWLMRGSRQPFEIVLLDHGTYLELSREMREQFCQLWCSFVLQDTELQAELSTNVAGKRGATVLPVLLTQTARSRAEERAVKKAAGIAGVGDMAALLQSAPRPVVEVLRINTVVRSISNQLGVTMGERRRILAAYARRGLPPMGSGARHVHARFNTMLCRVYLWAVMGAWQTSAAVRGVALRSWSLVLGLWADVLLD